MTPEDICSYLKAVARRPSEPSLDAVREALAALKQDAVAAGDEAGAKSVWCLEQALIVQEHYLRAFRHLKSGEFYEAWCELERTELELAALERHDTASWADFHLDFIQAHTAQWQSLFPYKMFFSPELLHTEKLCSICRRSVLPQSFCGHRVGEIYEGELCYRIITKLEGLGISMVDNPMQKYSVLFLRDEKTGKQRDQYNYVLVKYGINALRVPFDGWKVERTTRTQPHSRYADVGRNDRCPCESGKKYKKCCLREAGVVRPHFEFTFVVQPPDGIMQDVFIE
jgi:SEC-C motif